MRRLSGNTLDATSLRHTKPEDRAWPSLERAKHATHGRLGPAALTPAELETAAAALPVLSKVAGADRDLIAQRGIVRRLPSGTVYLHVGDTCSGIALITAGRIRVAKTAASGRSITLYHIVPGETCILATSCLLAGSSYPATATVAQPAAALLVPGDVFARLFAGSTAIRAWVLSQFTERLATVMALVEEVAFRKVDQRLARWLVTEGGRASGGVLALSHDDVATHIGSARVVVSRVLEEFEARGWVVLGLGILSLIVLLEGSVRWLGLIGLVPLGTAALGFRPLYKLLGISTCPLRRAP